MDVTLGGRETSTAQIAEGLARRGHEVTVLCQTRSYSAEGVDVRPLGRRGGFPVTRLRHFIADVQAEVADRKYDVVHAMLPVPGADVYQPRGGTVPARRAATARRQPWLGATLAALAAALNPRRKLMAALERAVIDDAGTLCLAVSYMVSQEIEEYYGRTDRVRVIYNAVDAPDPAGPQREQWRSLRRGELEVDEDTVVFLTVAVNFELKGVSEAIAAFARWRHGGEGLPDARLVVVGRDLPERYEQLAGMRSVGVEVVFKPPTREIFEWYAAADACVLLSWYDPCSRVVLEATRWGIPSITTVHNGAAEVISGAGGIVVSSPRDARSVVAAMAELADRDRRRAREDACRQVADRLGIDRHVDELLEAYADIIRRR